MSAPIVINLTIENPTPEIVAAVLALLNSTASHQMLRPPQSFNQVWLISRVIKKVLDLSNAEYSNLRSGISQMATAIDRRGHRYSEKPMPTELSTGEVMRSGDRVTVSMQTFMAIMRSNEARTWLISTPSTSYGSKKDEICLRFAQALELLSPDDQTKLLLF